MKYIWISLGWLSVGVGGVGVVIPGLPTTVFFVIAAACFSRSSPRFEQWVLDLPTFGPMVRDYRSGLGMPYRAKVLAITMMWTAIGLSAGFAIDILWIRLSIVGLGAIGTSYILFRVPTRETVLESRATEP